jgi:hypothetical protein
MSSLNMPPEAIKEPKGEYISDMDANVFHAMEHLRAAVDKAQEAYKEVDSVRDAIQRILVRIGGKKIDLDEVYTILDALVYPPDMRG